MKGLQTKEAGKVLLYSMQVLIKYSDKDALMLIGFCPEDKFCTKVAKDILIQKFKECYIHNIVVDKRLEPIDKDNDSAIIHIKGIVSLLNKKYSQIIKNET